VRGALELSLHCSRCHGSIAALRTRNLAANPGPGPDHHPLPQPQASRLGITTVVSTDSIRHMMRSFHPREAAPLLWASTYQAGEALPEGHAKRSGGEVRGLSGGQANVARPGASRAQVYGWAETPGRKCAQEVRVSFATHPTPIFPALFPLTQEERVIAGYKAQCALLAEPITALVAACEARCQSLVCEGESAARGLAAAGA
jgi:hypothetical protein